MSIPKEPRQKMINMMYLVLTALLALNVSSEILNAFRTVNNSLLNSNAVIDAKDKVVFASFKEMLTKEDKKEKAAIWFPKADKASQIAGVITSYLEGLKTDLKKESGLEIVDGEEKYKEDNLDAATRLFVDPGKAKGEEIKKKLQDFKDQLLAIDPAIAKEFNASLPLDLSVPKSRNKAVGNDDWAYSYFHMTPTIAAITILSKFQNDIKNSESKVVEFCHNQVGAVEQIFDTYAPIYGQSSAYLMPGQELRITAGIGAFNKNSRPQITVDGSPATQQPDGSYEYKTIVGGATNGAVKKLRISYFNQATGKQETRDVEIKYTVGSPTGISVSADAVKVLYIGVANPISISGGTKGAESINATINNGSLSNKGGGKFEANVDNPGKATINVSVDGKTTPFEFRVKRIPDPMPMVGNSGGGTIPVNAFKANVGVRADLKDFVFEGIKYDVTGFLLVAQGKGFENGAGFTQNKGAYFTSEAKSIIEKCKAGSTVAITDITVNGPDGSRKLVSSAVFNLSN